MIKKYVGKRPAAALSVWLLLLCLLAALAVVPAGATAPSIYAQQGKCRNHAAFSTLQTIKQPL